MLHWCISQTFWLEHGLLVFGWQMYLLSICVIRIPFCDVLLFIVQLKSLTFYELSVEIKQDPPTGLCYCFV